MGHDSLFGSDEEQKSDEECLEARKKSDESLILKNVGDEACESADGRFNALKTTTTPVEIPSIKGLYLFRDAISLNLQELLIRSILESKSVTSDHPQAMIFPKHAATRANQKGYTRDVDNAPEILRPLIEKLPELLRGRMPDEDYALVFDESLPIQTILNLYEPGQGITPHVDLPHRYAHPILGVSLASTTVMDFVPVDPPSPIGSESILLRPGDIYVLLHDARYAYKHGIAYRKTDTYVTNEGSPRTIYRGTRLSVTLRRMLPDAGKLFIDGNST